MKSDNTFLSFLGSGGASVKIAVIAIAIVGLLLVSGIFGGADGERVSEDLDDRLAEMCSMTEGVGECRVMISYADDGESVSAVAVLCEGAESAEVRARLVSMISSLFGIGSNRISVLKIS